MPVRALPMPAAVRLPVLPAPEHLQITQMVVADHDHVGPAAAVATVGTAARHVGLTAERNGAVPAATGPDEYARAILKHALTMAE